MANQTQTQPRRWLVDAQPVVIDAMDPAALQSELYEVMSLLTRVGGAVTVHTGSGNLVIGAIREKADPDGEFFETTAFVFQWTSSLPAARSNREPSTTVEPVTGRKLNGRSKRIFERDGYRCLVCGEDDVNKLTLDHIIPLAHGGRNTEENLQTLCGTCNAEKADSLPADIPGEMRVMDEAEVEAALNGG